MLSITEGMKVKELTLPGNRRYIVTNTPLEANGEVSEMNVVLFPYGRGTTPWVEVTVGEEGHPDTYKPMYINMALIEQIKFVD